MDSGLAGGSAPWTPEGYIPLANMLFIPVSNILFIPVSNILFIPVSYLLFISVSRTSFYISASIYYLAVLPALINFNFIPTHLKTGFIISLLYKPF